MSLPPTSSPTPVSVAANVFGRFASAGIRSLPAAFATLALTACAASGSGSGNGNTARELADEVLPASVEDGASLVIADQQQRVQVNLAASGEEAAFEFDHEYANFLGGPEILEAFRGKGADVAQVGDTPPIHAAAAGEDTLIIGAVRSQGGFRLVTSPGTEIDSAEELEGARVAYAEGTATGTAVLDALDRVGLTPDDVELVPLPTGETLEAVQADEVDVAPLNEPRLSRYLSANETKGAAVLPGEDLDELGSGLSFLYAPRSSLEDAGKASALRSLVKHWIKARHWADENPEEWIDSYYVESQALTREDGENIVEAEGTSVFPELDDELVAELQEVIDLLERSDALPVEVKADELFDTRFNEAIVEAVEESGAAHSTESGE